MYPEDQIIISNYTRDVTDTKVEKKDQKRWGCGVTGFLSPLGSTPEKMGLWSDWSQEFSRIDSRKDGAVE